MSTKKVSTKKEHRKFVYQWNGDIWAVHVQAKNMRDSKGRFSVEFTGTGHTETFILGPNEAMRYNFSRHSMVNDSLVFAVPEGIELELFENLDRAFYTADPSGLGFLKEI